MPYNIFNTTSSSTVIKQLLYTGITLGALLSAAPTEVQAAPRHTQRNQTARINQGVQNGSLTQGETAHLMAQQANIARKRVKASADGKVTKRERRSIKRSQRKANRNIYRKKHNRRER